MAAATPAGRYRDRIALQAREEGKGAHGRPNGAWRTVDTCWAAQLSARSLERFAAGQQQELIDMGLAIRYRTDISPDMRILWRGEPFDLVGRPTDADGNRRELVLLCTAGGRNTRD
nr:phage head closure protein [Variovorax boronicumulans]